MDGKFLSVKERFFRLTAGFMLAAITLSNIMAILIGAPALHRPDSLFTFISSGQLLILSSGLELMVAVGLWADNSRSVFGALLGLTALLLLYRMGRFLFTNYAPCNCLLGIARLFNLSAVVADTVPTFILAYFLIGILCIMRQPRRLAQHDRISQ